MNTATEFNEVDPEAVESAAAAIHFGRRLAAADHRDRAHDVLNITEAAAFLRCGPKAVRRLAKLKRIPHRKIDVKGSLRFSKAALEAWLREGGR